ncbi:MAG: hypothetical protein L0G99_13205, partial [Propionibacteriales bacterium]|nr:hypothetical protein [Propionibacteriales bacterium]
MRSTPWSPRLGRPLVSCALLAGVLVAACQASPPPGPGASTSPADRSPSMPPSADASSAPPAQPRCSDPLDLEQQVGQLFMVPASVSTADGTGSLLANTRAGSVILMGNSSAGVESTKRVTDAIRGNAEQPDGVELLIATDQEGGQVQRLSGPGFG